MPISGATIVYGSSNGGENVYCTNTEIYEKLCRASKMLNLKPHLCRNSNDFMVTTHYPHQKTLPQPHDCARCLANVHLTLK